MEDTFKTSRILFLYVWINRRIVLTQFHHFISKKSGMIYDIYIRGYLFSGKIARCPNRNLDVCIFVAAMQSDKDD